MLPFINYPIKEKNATEHLLFQVERNFAQIKKYVKEELPNDYERLERTEEEVGRMTDLGDKIRRYEKEMLGIYEIMKKGNTFNVIFILMGLFTMMLSFIIMYLDKYYPQFLLLMIVMYLSLYLNNMTLIVTSVSVSTGFILSVFNFRKMEYFEIFSSKDFFSFSIIRFVSLFFAVL